jgi:adenylosuccinate lyase
MIARQVRAAIPYMATENILMAAVGQGGDRQEIHERIRRHSHAVTAQLKAGGGENDLLDRLRSDPAFAHVNFEQVLQVKNFVGRAAEQVVIPIRRHYHALLNQSALVTV